MILLGNPWGLLGLLGLPLVLFLHLYRRRFRPQAVTALWLYGAPVTSQAAGRRRQPLRQRLSLWCEAGLVLLLTIWLADLHLGDRQQAAHHVWVLDCRPAMAARGPDGRTPIERLQEVLHERLAAMPAGDRLTIVASGGLPELRFGPAGRPARAAALVDDWQARPAWHPLAPAWSLAADVLTQDAATTAATEAAGVLVCSDRRHEELPDGAALLAAGLPVDNQAIVDLRWQVSAVDGADRVLVRLANFSDAAAERRLQLALDEAVLVEQTVALPADGSELVGLDLPVPAPERLRCRLLGTDGLANDDAFLLERPAVKRLRVALAVSERWQPAITTACQVLPAVELVAADARAHWSVHEPADQAPVLPPPSGTWQLLLKEPVDAAPAAVGPFLARRGHPALVSCDFTGVVWTGGEPLAGCDPAEVLIAGGDRALLTAAGEARQQRLVLSCAPSASTLTRHPAWPALWQNLMAWRRDWVPGVQRRNLPIAQASRVVLPAGATRLRLTHADGEVLALNADGDGVVALPPLPLAGGWRLDLPADAGRDELTGWQRLNVLACDARGSDVRSATTMQKLGEAAQVRSVERRPRPLVQALLVGLLVGLALLAWWAFAREQGTASSAGAGRQ